MRCGVRAAALRGSRRGATARLPAHNKSAEGAAGHQRYVLDILETGVVCRGQCSWCGSASRDVPWFSSHSPFTLPLPLNRHPPRGSVHR